MAIVCSVSRGTLSKEVNSDPFMSKNTLNMIFHTNCSPLIFLLRKCQWTFFSTRSGSGKPIYLLRFYSSKNPWISTSKYFCENKIIFASNLNDTVYIYIKKRRFWIKHFALKTMINWLTCILTEWPSHWYGEKYMKNIV